MLSLHELTKHFPTAYGDPVRAVDGVSLAVAPGELLALYGPSGSGKTTLMMLIAALLKPDEGRVIVDGCNVSALSAREAARYRLLDLGFVRQSMNLMAGADAIDNAALKLMGADVGAREARRRIAPLLDRLGLRERALHRPEQLSMGERQRVMIARALSTNPKLILADEPTGSLDSQRSAEVLGLLSDLCRDHGTAVLLVTHDPQAAAYADRVYTLLDGRLVEPELDGAAVPRKAG